MLELRKYCNVKLHVATVWLFIVHIYCIHKIICMYVYVHLFLVNIGNHQDARSYLLLSWYGKKKLYMENNIEAAIEE